MHLWYRIRKDCKPKLGVQAECAHPTDLVRSEGQEFGLEDDAEIHLRLDHEEADDTKKFRFELAV